MATAAIGTTIPRSIQLVYSRPKPQRFYAPELDALRFAAFLSIFLRHILTVVGHLRVEMQGSALHRATYSASSEAGKIATVQGLLQGLDFGVCLFFFLSAFLISRLLLTERSLTGTVAVKDFYLRRILRIWPLYYVFLLAVVVVSPFVPVLHVGRERVLAAVFFFANWAAVFHGWSDIAIQPLWSVSIEEQFYLAWPLAARFGRRTIAGVAFACMAISLGTLIYYGNRPGTQITAHWANTLVQSMFFAGGALTACFSQPESRSSTLPARALRVIAGLGLWGLASTGFHIARTESPAALQLVMGYLSVLAGTYLIFTGVAGMKQFKFPKPLLQLGKISYGLYIFHSVWLLLVSQWVSKIVHTLHTSVRVSYLIEFAACLLSLVPIVACAALSYKLLEKPFLRFKDRFTVIRSRPV